MKKGNYGPRVRCRWMYAPTLNAAALPCTWIKPVAGGAVFVWEILGIPVPLTVDWTDCSPGKYSYNEANHVLYYTGLWSTLGFDGGWQLSLQTDWDQWCRADFTIYSDFGAGVAKAITWNDGVTTALQMDVATNRTYNMGQIFLLNPPWIFSALWAFRGLQYHEIRADGNDPDNTAPLVWAP